MARLIESVAIVGTGNVAWQLGRACLRAGYDLRSIYGRKPSGLEDTIDAIKAGIHDRRLNIKAAYSPDSIPSDIDLCIVAVSDRAIADICGELTHIQGIVAHTSGSVSIDAIPVRQGGRAVVYPLQTFSKGRELLFKHIPVYIEADSPQNEANMIKFAQSLSDVVRIADSDMRKRIHLAGVFANNFVNALLGMAGEQMELSGCPTEDLKPIIEETISKYFDWGAVKAQTGPASRNDVPVMDIHQTMLDSDAQKEVYQAISLFITSNHKNR